MKKSKIQNPKSKIILSVLFVLSVLSAQTGARYLIIAHDNFYDAVQPLAEWKTKKGMMCVVKKTSETGTSNTAIRDYIISAYNSWMPRPEFVLLVGGPSYIYAFTRGMSQGRIDTDNPYGNMSGDYRAELPYGRLPCKTPGSCSLMVAKILAYERHPHLADTAWYQKGTTIVNDSADSDAYTYWNDIRTVAALCAQNGYRAIDSLASLRHHNAYSVAQSVNSGTSFVLYRGTGTDYWRTPFDMRPYLGGLTNYKPLPIICSFTCQTVSLNSYNDSMTGNTWIKVGTPDNPTGAVAVIGNTHSASNVAGRRSAMTRGFFTGLLSESLLNLGSITLRGKLQLYNEYHDSMDYMGFNLLGDPELNVWTSPPHPSYPSYPSQIPIGPQDFMVQVSGHGGQPLRNALVCVRSGSGIYQYGYTAATGGIVFSINPNVPGTMEVTVTARNCIPHEGQVEIYDPSAISEPQSSIFNLQSSIRITPNPGPGPFAITWKIGDMMPHRVPNLQVFTSTGRLVANLQSSIFNLQSGTAIWDAHRVPAGIYVVRATRRRGGPPCPPANTVLQIVR